MSSPVDYQGVPFYLIADGTPSPIAGSTGPLYRYTLYIQQGLGLHGGDVARQIDGILADKRGWTRGAVRFQRVATAADTDVLVAAPGVVDALCYPLMTEGKVSCNQGRKVVINVIRWKTAVPHWRPGKRGRLTSYRQMLVNHEFGHRIGKNHENCGGAGKRAPVMQQQTYGLQSCLANPWPLDHELLE